jgi:hypothetical protein
MKHLALICSCINTRLLVSAFVALVVCVAPQDCRSGESTGTRLAALEADPVEAGHEALSQGRRPWYDAETDATQRVKLRAPFDFPEFGALDGTWTQALAWSTLTLLAVLLIAGLVYAVLSWQRPIDNNEPDIEHLPDLSAARSELLPVRAGSTADALRTEAQEHFAAGRYGEAVVCLYSFGLLALDRSQMIHLARGKTNRQYLRELSRSGPLHAPMQQMVDAFEGYFFGGHDVSRQRCEQCLAHVDTIQAAAQEVNA